MLFLYSFFFYFIVNTTAYHIEQYLGTKAPYSKPKHVFASRSSPTCRLVQLHLLSRHGSRYPTTFAISQFQKLESFIKLYQNSSLGTPLEGFLSPFEMRDAGELHPVGQSNLKAFGKRFRQSYSKFIVNASQQVSVQTTEKVLFILLYFLSIFYILL